VTTAYRSTRVKVQIAVDNHNAPDNSDAHADLRFKRRSGESVDDFIKRVRSAVARKITATVAVIGERTDA
jgi:hypothetical protein